jgi:hypothetical protein
LPLVKKNAYNNRLLSIKASFVKKRILLKNAFNKRLILSKGDFREIAIFIKKTTFIESLKCLRVLISPKKLVSL